MKELKNLQVGDVVLVTGMSYRRIAKIDKTTKTQIIVDNAKFNKDSGWQCGSDRWNVRKISVPTEKVISDVKEENFRKKLIHAMKYNLEQYNKSVVAAEKDTLWLKTFSESIKKVTE